MLGPANRDGFSTVTPYVYARDPDAVVAFLADAFGGDVTYRSTGDAGGHHVEVQVGDARLMLGGGGTSEVDDQPAAFFLYVDDVDDVHDRAVAAGASSMMKPADGLFEEERGAAVVDPFGHQWFLARHGPSSAAPG